MKALLALLIALPLAGCAVAGGNFSRPGPYVGIGVTESFESFDPPGGLRVSNSDLGGSLRAGMRLSPAFAVEGIAEAMPNFRVRSTTASADVDLLTAGVQGKYYVLTDVVQPYVVGGVGKARFRNNDFDWDGDGTYLRGGAGTDLYLNEGLALFGECTFNRTFGDVRDHDHVNFQVGLTIRF